MRLSREARLGCKDDILNTESSFSEWDESLSVTEVNEKLDMKIRDFKVLHFSSLNARTPGLNSPLKHRFNDWLSLDETFYWIGSMDQSRLGSTEQSSCWNGKWNMSSLLCFRTVPAMRKPSFSQTCPSSHGADSSKLWARYGVTGMNECPTALYFRSYCLLLKFLQKKNCSFF